MLVTGASGGIGAAIVAAVARDGAFVVAHYGGNEAGARAAVAALPAERVLLVGEDLAEPGAARRLWARAVDWRGRVDVVVVNAALNVETPFEGSDDEWDEGWARTLQVNVIESSSLIRSAVAHFRSSGGGVLVGVSSWSGQQGSAIPALSAYAASKAAVKAVIQTVARAYGRDGVLAYVVAPGIVRTDMALRNAEGRGGEEAMQARLALGELVPPEEVGDLVAVLATGRFRHLTGATVDVNGASYVR